MTVAVWLVPPQAVSAAATTTVDVPPVPAALLLRVPTPVGVMVNVTSGGRSGVGAPAENDTAPSPGDDVTFVVAEEPTVVALSVAKVAEAEKGAFGSLTTSV